MKNQKPMEIVRQQKALIDAAKQIAIESIKKILLDLEDEVGAYICEFDINDEQEEDNCSMIKYLDIDIIFEEKIYEKKGKKNKH